MDDKKQKRSRRNARHYQKRKRVGDKGKVIELFRNDRPDAAKQSKIGVANVISILACLALATVLSAYLMAETIDYFSNTEGRGILSVIKGCLSELIVIAFSMFSFRDFGSRIMQRVVLVGMTFYSLWAISSGVIVASHREYRESESIRQMIVDTEKQIREKEEASENYLRRDRLSVLRKNQVESDRLKERLNSLRRQSVEARPESLILNTVLNLVLFRFLAMIANILLVRRLKELLGNVLTGIQSEQFEIQPGAVR